MSRSSTASDLQKRQDNKILKNYFHQLTNFQDPDVAKATAVHPTIYEETGSYGDPRVALAGRGGGAFEDGTLPLETSTLSNLQVAEITQVSEKNS